MGSVSRESIDIALFKQISKNLPQNVRTVSRRVKHFSDVEPSATPAVFVTKVGEITTRRKGQPPVMTSQYDISIYVNEGGSSKAIPAEVLNPILDAVCNSIEPPPSYVYQDLGIEAVSHCFVSGNTVIVEGIDGKTTVAIVPVEILWT